MAGRVADNDVVVELRSQPRLLQAARGLVRGYASALGFPRDTVDDIVLAVDEACCNSIRHAYGGEGDCRLYLSLNTTRSGMVVELRDEGTPAEPERVKPRPLAPPNLDELTPGGLGIPLIYRVFDDVEFIPGKRRGNRLVMRLKCDQVRPVPGDGEA